MKNFLRVLTVVLLFGMLLATTACATTAATEKLVLTETDERMFWEIHGTSLDGTPSTVYILGTIHLGDERLYPLPDAVQDAFENADRVFGELSAEDMVNAQTVLVEKMAAVSENIDPENTLANHLSQDEIIFLESIFGQEYLQTAFLFDPWFLLMLLTTFELEKTELTAEYGLDFVLLSNAAEIGIEVKGLDTLETQMNIIIYEAFTFAEQLEILHETIKAFMEVKPSDLTTDDMYDIYIDNDKEGLAEFFEEEETTSIILEKYMKLVLADRDSAWAQLIPTYIEEGGTTFIFAGAAHFVGDNSVFEHMKRNEVLVMKNK